MDFEQQKPITDEFRKGWERIYVQQEVRKFVLNVYNCANDKSYPAGTLEYSNGCPILSDGPQKDDL